MEYEIITATTHKELSRKVTQRISWGWELQGGISIKVVGGDTVRYYQAMTRK